MPSRWTDRRIARLISLVLLAPLGWRAATWFWPPPKPVVARDTTWLTEPLDEDGWVDYARAWREERSRGVTAENNAAPLVFAAAGLDTNAFTEAERAQLPKLDVNFLPFFDWVNAHEAELKLTTMKGPELSTDVYGAMERGDVEDPAARVAFQWLDAMSPALDLARGAVERERFFVPNAWSGDGSDARTLGELASGLKWRAARALARGDSEAAGADLRAGLRLARLEAQVGVGDWFVVAFEAEKGALLAAWIQARKKGRFSSAELRAILDADDPSGVEPRVRDLLRFSRCRTLDLLDGLLREGSDLRPSFKGSRLVISRLDPNLIRRRQNDWFDRELGILLDDAPFDQRLGRFDGFLEEVRAARRTSKRWQSLAIVWRSPDSAARILFDGLFLNPVEPLAYVVHPLLWTDRALIELAALAYATEQGRDPATSDDLTPSLFATPWRDRVTHSAVTFHRDKDGWLVAAGPVIDSLPRIDASVTPPVVKSSK